MASFPQEHEKDISPQSRGYLTFTVFLAGSVTMSVEFGASRLLGNVFGTSNIVWAVVIGLVLVYLTLGNWLGGRLADKTPSARVYYSVLAWAALGAGAVPLISRPVLRAAAEAFYVLNLGVLAGAFTAVILLVLFSLLGLRGTDKRTPGLVYETESAYNYIQVLEVGGFRFLRLNEGQGVHSIYHPTNYFFSGPWDQVLVAPYFNSGARVADVRRIALLGLAAGTSARQANVVYPMAQVDGFEIDPTIVEVGREWFGMDLPNLTVFVEDARWGLAHSAGAYDIISVDAYRPPYIPAHLVTREFFMLVYEKLSARGVMVINIGRSTQDRSLVDTLSATVGQVFPVVLIADLPESYNTILFADKNPNASWEALEQNLALQHSVNTGSALAQIMDITRVGRMETRFAESIFTDDKAPIEFMTNRLVINFLLEGDKE